MLIQALSAMRYTAMMNNAAYNMMSTNNARMGLLSSPMNNISFGALAAMDTQLGLQSITNSLEYQMYKAMAEQSKKQLKEDIKQSFSIFA
jgi:hypothetical protein